MNMIFRFIDSLGYAIEGILHAARSQRHIRYHLFATLILLLSCFALGINREDFIILTVMATLVLFAEMINSAIEEIVNIISPKKNTNARIIKDMAAGAVLMISGVALIVAYYLIVPYVRFYIKNGVSIAKHTGPDIATGSIIIVLILVIVIKAYTGKGHPLRGGMPSGHSAVAFSVWVAFSYTLRNFPLSIILFIVALVVAISRVKTKIHTVSEVIVGGLVGIGVTFLLYAVFY